MNKFKGLIVGVFYLTFTLTSCSESKIAQCQEIAQISQKIAEQAQASRHTKDSDKIREMAQKFAEVAQELEQLQLSDQQLQTYKTSLAQVYRNYSKSTVLMLEAVKNQDVKTARLAKEEVTASSKDEKTLGEEMNNYCQPSG